MRRMLPALLAYMTEPATCAGFARMYRRLYDALVAEGFSSRDALAIVSAQRPSAQATASGGSI